MDFESQSYAESYRLLLAGPSSECDLQINVSTLTPLVAPQYNRVKSNKVIFLFHLISPLSLFWNKKNPSQSNGAYEGTCFEAGSLP